MSIPLPFPPICFQCGTDQNPCHCKVIGPTLGFLLTVILAIVCWPASIFCLCCATEAGKKLLAFPADSGTALGNAIPI